MPVCCRTGSIRHATVGTISGCDGGHSTGMGHGAWGMGHGAWGTGHGARGTAHRVRGAGCGARCIRCGGWGTAGYGPAARDALDVRRRGDDMTRGEAEE